MRTYVLLITLIMLSLLLGCKPEETKAQFKILSPDARIQVALELISNIPTYAVSVDGETIISPSKLGYEFRGMTKLTGPFKLLNASKQEIDDDWVPVWGQENLIRSHSNNIKIELQEINNPHRLLNLSFQVFNDGVGFRYEIPKQTGIDSVFISAENTEFKFARDAQVWWIPADYDSYEKIYTKSRLSELTDSVHTPLTMITDGGYFVSLHEANLTKYASMTLVKDDSDSLKLVSDLVPWPDGDKVKTTLPLQSPWRTIMIGHDAADLLKSRLILNLNEPNRLTDVSWIKPMKYIGIWWGLHIGKETWIQGEHHGATTANTKDYIDFATANNIQGVLVEGWNHDWERWGQPSAFKFNSPYDDFDIVEITRYAKENDVVLIGHHETGGEAPFYDQQLEQAYAYCQQHGIPAVKSGYAGTITPSGQHHHGQWMVEHYRRVVEMAARYQITLDVHEPIKPTGIERTWPNMMTREGARGMEWNAWSDGNPPDHTTILPFTRLLAGPMDYTPGIFDLHYSEFKPENRVHTTLAKQLALMVIMYSPLQMAADLIENYENQPAFQFIRDLKTDWDETIYLQAEIGEQIALARRHGEEWFIAAITNEKEREVVISLDKLVKQDMIIEIYSDGLGADWESNPYPIHIGAYRVTPTDKLTIWLAPGGGFAARVRLITPNDQSIAPIADFSLDSGHKD